MEPTLIEGDSIVFEESLSKTILLNDIVLAHHPFKKNIKIIKRVKKIKNDKLFFLLGDNIELGASSDSNSFGYIEKENIIGILSK